MTVTYSGYAFCCMSLIEDIRNRHAFGYINFISVIHNRHAFYYMNSIQLYTTDIHLLRELYTFNAQQTLVTFVI